MLGQTNSNAIAAYIKIKNQDITVTENGVYEASSEYTGLGTVDVNVQPKLKDEIFTENGVYTVSPETYVGLDWGLAKQAYTGSSTLVGDYIWLHSNNFYGPEIGDSVYNGQIVNGQTIPNFEDAITTIRDKNIGSTFKVDFLSDAWSLDAYEPTLEFDGLKYFKISLHPDAKSESSVTIVGDCVWVRADALEDIVKNSSIYNSTDSSDSAPDTSAAIGTVTSDDNKRVSYLFADIPGWAIGYSRGQVGSSYTENWDGYHQVTVDVEGTVNNQDKTVTPSISEQIVQADEGYSGLGTVTINPVTSAIDPNIVSQNIVEGVSILGVEGSAETTTIEVTSSQLIAVASNSDNAVLSNDNGTTWTTETLSSSSTWVSFAYGNGTYVLLAEDKFAYSSDGTTWTEKTITSSTDWNEVIYNDGKFVAVTFYESPSVAYSTDGENWDSYSIPEIGKDLHVAYGNGVYVVVSVSSSTNAYVYSTDGRGWTAASFPSFSFNGYGKIVYGNGKFVLVNQTKSAYSTDGINWVESDLPESGLWWNLLYTNGTFLCINTSGNQRVAGYHTLVSQDGINWSVATQSISYVEGFNAICSTPTGFVGFGTGGVYTFKAGLDGIWSATQNNPAVTGSDWSLLAYSETVTRTTVDAMLDEINGENVNN